MVTVLVVEDHVQYRQQLVALLREEADFRVVGAVGDGHQAVRLTGLHLPNVILMDLGLPTLDGIEATRQIRLAYPSVNVLVLTVFDDDDRVFEAVKAGARGYLLKGLAPEDLPHAIREVALGHSLIHPTIARKLLDEFQRLARGGAEQKAAPGEDAHLSAREREVLQGLAQGQSLPKVADGLGVSPETVKTYVKRIYEKLEVSSKAEAIMAGVRRGLIDPGSGR